MTGQLLQRAKAGDVLAWNELIDKHKSMAYSIAYKFLKNKEDAEDIVQDAFVIVLESIKSFRNEAKFSTWLYKIIYHESIRHLKANQRTVEYLPQFTQWENPEEKAEGEEILPGLLNRLNPNEFTVISLFYLEEKSLKEIHQITSFSLSNIKVLMHRARTKMKEYHKQDQSQ